MILREMTREDRRFVAPTWARGSRYAMSLSDRFRLVDRLIDGGARVVVAGTTGNAVHGWAAGEDDVLHFVYVPPELRREGVARSLIRAVLGGYPEHIKVSHRWPFGSRRFRYVHDALLRSEVAA